MTRGCLFRGGGEIMRVDVITKRLCAGAKVVGGRRMLEPRLGVGLRSRYEVGGAHSRRM
jgi:hypothetical protein